MSPDDHIVHGALACGKHPKCTEQRVGHYLTGLHIAGDDRGGRDTLIATGANDGSVRLARLRYDDASDGLAFFHAPPLESPFRVPLEGRGGHDGAVRAAAFASRRRLVTGGAGFIGSTLAARLLQLGYAVRVLDNLSTGARAFVPSEAEFVRGDVREYSAVEAAMRGGVTVVFHLAAMSKVEPSLTDPAMVRFCLENNVLGTDNVLRAALEAKTVRKVVYAASSTYYGDAPTPHSESATPHRVTSPYASSKAEGERLCLLYDRLHGLPTVSLRLFMVYGDRQPSEGAYKIVTGAFLANLERGEALSVEGDGSHFRDFVHVADAADAFALAAQNPSARGVAMNVGSGSAWTIEDVAEMIGGADPGHVHVAERRHDLVGTLADTCLAKRLIGFSATRSFEEETRREAARVRGRRGEGSGGGEGSVG